MKNAYVFGYGSLVNPATHTYVDTQPAHLTGWRREWRHAANRQVAFLTVVPSETDKIDGLVARVPPEDWADLDAREASYLKEMTASVSHRPEPDAKLFLYHAPRDLHPPAAETLPVLLSYLDVVVQGYLRTFGEQGVANFFASTDGWDAPVLDDRAAPRYRRHQPLTADERALTDEWLGKL